MRLEERGTCASPASSVFHTRCLCTRCSSSYHAIPTISIRKTPPGNSTRKASKGFSVSTSHRPPAQTRQSAAPSPGPIWKLISLFYHTLGYGKNLGCGVRPQLAQSPTQPPLARDT